MFCDMSEIGHSSGKVICLFLFVYAQKSRGEILRQVLTKDMLLSNLMLCMVRTGQRGAVGDVHIKKLLVTLPDSILSSAAKTLGIDSIV